MNKEIYVIYYDETETSKKYIETIYRNSVIDDSDIGDAIEFYDKETAQKVAKYLNKRKSVSKFKVMCIKNTFEEIE